MATVRAICVSEVRGVQKREVSEAYLRREHGVEGDAHAGPWHRQVSLLSASSVERLQERVDFPLVPGAFAENILVDGLDVWTLPVGTRLTVGGALCEVTQIGKQCHNDCEIKRTTGKCVMPTEGIFAIVIKEGRIQAGDEIEVLKK